MKLCFSMKGGLICDGFCNTQRLHFALLQVIELSPEHEHPFYLATQFHPEFKSRPGHPAPPFLGLLLAATGKLESGLRDCMKRGPVNHYRATGNNSFNSFNNNCIGYTQPTSQA